VLKGKDYLSKKTDMCYSNFDRQIGRADSDFEKIGRQSFNRVDARRVFKNITVMSPTNQEIPSMNFGEMGSSLRSYGSTTRNIKIAKLVSGEADKPNDTVEDFLVSSRH